jgi:hypothetical protein
MHHMARAAQAKAVAPWALSPFLGGYSSAKSSHVVVFPKELMWQKDGVHLKSIRSLKTQKYAKQVSCIAVFNERGLCCKSP